MSRSIPNQELLSQTQRRYQLFAGFRDPLAVMAGWVETESDHNPYAIRYEHAFRWIPQGLQENTTEWVARKTSWGLLQIMGQVAREHGFDARYLSELLDPQINLRYAALHLLQMKERGDGTWEGALAAYNGGLAGNERPVYRTQRYVDKVLSNSKKYERSVADVQETAGESQGSAAEVAGEDPRLRALVLSGGGAKGAFQYGAIAGLVEQGQRWDQIYGVSVGALNGAMLAQGKLVRLGQIWTTIEEDDIHSGGLNFGRVLRLVLKRRRSLYDLKGLMKMIRKEVRRENVVTPCFVGVTSLRTGQYGLYDQSHPNFVEAVLASAIMPIIWEPTRVGSSEDIVDGGLRNITPLGDAIDRGATDITVILNSPFDLGAADDLRSIKDVALRTLEIIMNEVFVNDIKKTLKVNDLLRDHDIEGYKPVNVRIIQPEESLGDTLDFSQESIRRRIRLGRAAVT